MEPYKDVFGQPPKIGLGSKIPQEFFWLLFQMEEDMIEILKTPENHSNDGLDVHDTIVHTDKKNRRSYTTYRYNNG